MRLSPVQIATIKSTVSAVLGHDARVTLFGSRLDDRLKGGDVDLYVEMHHPRLMQNIRCKIQLDLPVDLIVKPVGDASPISRIAKDKGVPL